MTVLGLLKEDTPDRGSVGSPGETMVATTQEVLCAHSKIALFLTLAGG